jgi:hypothetical protein
VDEYDRAFETPEEATLAEWVDYPQAEVRIISVEYTDEDHAVVVTDTNPSHPMWNYCERTDRGWIFTSDHN